MATARAGDRVPGRGLCRASPLSSSTRPSTTTVLMLPAWPCLTRSSAGSPMRLEVGGAEVEQQQVGPLARGDRAGHVTEAELARAVQGRHPQKLTGCDRLPAGAGDFDGLHRAQRPQYVGSGRHGQGVGRERDRYACLKQLADQGEAHRPQLGDRAERHAGAGGGQHFDVGGGGVDGVDDLHVGAEQVPVGVPDEFAGAAAFFAQAAVTVRGDRQIQFAGGVPLTPADRLRGPVRTTQRRTEVEEAVATLVGPACGEAPQVLKVHRLLGGVESRGP